MGCRVMSKALLEDAVFKPSESAVEDILGHSVASTVLVVTERSQGLPDVPTRQAAKEVCQLDRALIRRLPLHHRMGFRACSRHGQEVTANVHEPPEQPLPKGETGLIPQCAVEERPGKDMARPLHEPHVTCQPRPKTLMAWPPSPRAPLLWIPEGIPTRRIERHPEFLDG